MRADVLMNRIDQTRVSSVSIQVGALVERTGGETLHHVRQIHCSSLYVHMHMCVPFQLIQGLPSHGYLAKLI